MKAFILALGFIITASSATTRASWRIFPRKTCDTVLPSHSPLAAFFEELEELRKQEASREEIRKKLDRVTYRSEFMQAIASSTQYEFAVRLADPRRAKQDARDILDRLLKSHFKQRADNLLFRPLFGSVAELEAHFDPERIVEISLSADLADAVSKGEKTATVRLNNLWEIKSGKGEFIVAGTGERIPVVIEKVKFRVNLLHLRDEEMLRRQGPDLAHVLETDGKATALRILVDSLRRFYPTEDLNNSDFTVVYFQRILQ